MAQRRSSLERWKERGRVRRPEPGEVLAPAEVTVATGLDGFVATLGRASTAMEAVNLLFDEAAALPGVDAAFVALLDEEATWATGFAARGADESWWRGVAVDVRHEPGGIATAVRERHPFAVYDVETSATINRRLASAAGAKSAAFVPLLAERRVVGVLVLASIRDRRFFTTAELEWLQRLADATAVVVERARSADALRRALDRERLVAEIAGKVRSELDLDDVLQVAVEETGRALGVARCFIRLGTAGEMPVRAIWRDEGVRPLEVPPERLPVSNLALRERRTIAVGDVEQAPELDDPAIGDRAALVANGTRAVLATPIVVFDRVIGVFSLHRAETGAWPASEIAAVEAIAGEVGVAIHTAELLAEDERRLEEQAALLNAAQVVTSDLRLDTVLQRLVAEVASLFAADAADCWMFEPGQDILRCRAVHGLPAEEIGRRLTPSGTFADAITSGRPVLKRDFARTEDPPPSRNFSGFEEVMVAPIAWLGEVRGVLGVCSRTAGHFRPSGLEVLDAFARFASLASHNAESFEERERQAQIQRGFYRIAEVLGSPLSLAETLDALAQAAAEALGGAGAAVLVLEDEELRLAGRHKLPDDLAARLGEGLAPATTPFAAAAREERIVSSTGLADDDRFDEAVRALLQEHGYAAVLSAPVQRTSGENGAVVVLFGAEASFSDDDLALARHLSGAARGALERAELYETERRARSLSQRLATLGAHLVTNLDPKLVIEEVVRDAPGLVDADAAAIRLLEGDELIVRAAAGTPGSVVGTRGSSGAGLPGRVAQSRRPVTVEDARAAPQLARGEPLLGELVASVAVPMTAHGGRLHGVLSVYARGPRAWREDEVQALVALGAMASAALSNAELYQRVAEEKERSDAILANIADGIVAVDREGRIVLWNAMAERITGVPASEALGRRAVEALQREIASDGPEEAGERQISIERGGKELWLSLTEAVMRDSNGAVLGRIFAFRDVSGERAVEQLKSDFVATVSHELRTPLTSIYGFAETLRRSDIDFGEDDRATFLGYIASESEHLIRIVDDLLTVARVEAGTLGLGVAPVEVRQIVTEVVERFAASTNGSHEFVVDVPEGLRAAADPNRLSEVFHHLVDNAIKYSPQGGKVTLTGRRTADTVEIRVSDDGIGIPAGDEPRIFAKFYRGERSPLGATEGTGVGLFVARGLLAAMNGRVWAETGEERGSTFVVELPVSNAL